MSCKLLWMPSKLRRNESCDRRLGKGMCDAGNREFEIQPKNHISDCYTNCINL